MPNHFIYVLMAFLAYTGASLLYQGIHKMLFGHYAFPWWFPTIFIALLTFYEAVWGYDAFLRTLQ